jgi:hypothetical protein
MPATIRNNEPYRTSVDEDVRKTAKPVRQRMAGRMTNGARVRCRSDRKAMPTETGKAAAVWGTDQSWASAPMWPRLCVIVGEKLVGGVRDASWGQERTLTTRSRKDGHLNMGVSQGIVKSPE